MIGDSRRRGTMEADAGKRCSVKIEFIALQKRAETMSDFKFAGVGVELELSWNPLTTFQSERLKHTVQIEPGPAWC